MTRRMILLAGVLAVFSGCGGSAVTDLTQQALHEVRSGQYDKAIATSTRVIQADPRNAEAYLYRGRAYHYRNAMGDPKLAIADFTEAIRLAPEFSDAYYSRALVYRDLGETDLAAADDEAARKADGTIRDVYAKLPDAAPRPVVADEPEGDGGKERKGSDDPFKQASGSPDEQRATYEKLKQQYEPGFGTFRGSKPNTDLGQTRAEPSREDIFRELMEESADARSRERGAAEDELGVFGGQSRTPSERLPTDVQGTEGTAQDFYSQFSQPLTPGAPRPNRAPRDGVPSVPPSLHSPFPQRAPAPTGRVEQQLTNPFGPQAGPSTQTNINSPFSSRASSRPTYTPTYTNPYSNPAVRPPNPRDYLP